ncbi:MAG: lysophospholipase [Microbacteriaceae bacterium]|nr:lysophospholipase [Microbacteriaceae bacterium]MCL2794835.1 lysophospholipase [Microbacteriaceae bacterium]
MPTFTDAQGVEITYYAYPAENPKAVVQLAHGIGEHAGRYAHVAAALNRAGYTVYADDHRGHGQTGMAQWAGDVAKLGKLGPGGLRATVEDLRQLDGIIRAEHPGVPVVLLGHSWGSLMAQLLVNKHAADYDGVVLTGTAFRMFGSMGAGNFNAKWKSPEATGREWLSRDPEIQNGFNTDPLTFDADVLGKFGLVDALRLFGRPAKRLERDIPLLIQIGSEDPLGGEKSVVKLANAYRERSGLTDITVHVYADARHEVFNETNRDEVLADLVAWLDGRFAGPAR